MHVCEALPFIKSYICTLDNLTVQLMSRISSVYNEKQ